MLKSWAQVLGVGMSILIVAATSWAQGEIVDTVFVEQALARGAVLWDARDAADYAEGHIPGAVNLGPGSKARSASVCRHALQQPVRRIEGKRRRSR